MVMAGWEKQKKSLRHCPDGAKPLKPGRKPQKSSHLSGVSTGDETKFSLNFRNSAKENVLCAFLSSRLWDNSE